MTPEESIVATSGLEDRYDSDEYVPSTLSVGAEAPYSTDEVDNVADIETPTVIS